MNLLQKRDAGFAFYWVITMVLSCLPAQYRLKHALDGARVCARLSLLMLSATERRRITRNLELILQKHCTTADLSRTILSHYEMHSWNFIVNALLPRLSQSEIASFSEVRGLEHLMAAKAEGRGVVLLSAHIGAHAYTILAVLLAHGCPVTAVLGPELINEEDASWFYAKLIAPIRSSTRSLLPILERGAASPADIGTPLLRNETVFILGDMHLTPKQVAQERHALPVPFLWGTASVRTGPLRLPKLYGSPVLPTFAVRKEDRVILEIERPLRLSPGKTRDDLIADLRAYLERLEPRILYTPEQWEHLRHDNIPNWICAEQKPS